VDEARAEVCNWDEVPGRDIRKVRIGGRADNVAFVKWMLDVRNDNFRTLIRVSESGTYGFKIKTVQKNVQDATNFEATLFKQCLQFGEGIHLDIHVYGLLGATKESKQLVSSPLDLHWESSFSYAEVSESMASRGPRQTR